MTRARAIRATVVVAAFLTPFAAATSSPAASASAAATCSPSVNDDFNGDGHADMAVSQGNLTDMGTNGKSAVRVLYGSSTGITKAANLYLDGTGITGFTPSDDDQFGVSTAIGDFNGDGCADLAVAIAGVSGTSTAGGIAVYYGSPAGLKTTGVTFIPGASIVPTTQATSSFLKSTAAGDFNGDSYDDLVIGVPSSKITSPGTGGIAVLYGSPTGLTTIGKQYITQATPGVIGAAQSGDEFGSAVAAGDFDGNGYADIAVGSPFQDVGSVDEAGAVTILYGSASGIIATGSTQWSQASPGVSGLAVYGDGFGGALAAGNINNDGKADLVIGTPQDNVGTVPGAGSITLLLGSATGITATGSSRWSQNSTGVPGTSEENDTFGASLSIGDLNGDGYGDVAVGVPYESIGSIRQAGYVNVLYGSASGLTGTGSQGWDQNSPGISGTSEPQDILGWSVQVANLSSAAHADLVIGVQYESSSSKIANGMLNVILGSTGAGLTATGNQGLDATGMVNGPVDFGRLGTAIS